jgi:hypothetical protein
LPARLAERLLPSFTPDMLVVADRNFLRARNADRRSMPRIEAGFPFRRLRRARERA